MIQIQLEINTGRFQGKGKGQVQADFKPKVKITEGTAMDLFLLNSFSTQETLRFAFKLQRQLKTGVAKCIIACVGLYHPWLGVGMNADYSFCNSKMV